MRHRQLNKYCEVQTRTIGNDLAGEPVETWTTTRSEWGDLRPASVREYEQGQQMQSEITHVCWMRYFDGCNARQRLVIESRTFDVVGVFNVDERNRFLKWQLKEIT